MRKLYEIDKSIEDLIESVTDPESGEVVDLDALDTLLLEREQKVEHVILYRKDVLAEAYAIKAEMEELDRRFDRLMTTADSLKTYIENALDGQNFKTARCEVTHRKSEAVEVDDGFIEWAYSHKEDMSNYIIHKESDAPNNTEIRKLIKKGGSLPYCRLIEKNNITIK